MSMRDDLLADIQREKELKLQTWRDRANKSYTKPENRAKQKARQHKNKDYLNAAAIVRRREYRRRLIKAFGDKCHDCNTSYHMCVYDFHHLDSKGKLEQQLLTYKSNCSYEAMVKRVEGCVMLCSNCHRVRHRA